MVGDSVLDTAEGLVNTRLLVPIEGGCWECGGGDSQPGVVLAVQGFQYGGCENSHNCAGEFQAVGSYIHIGC